MRVNIPQDTKRVPNASSLLECQDENGKFELYQKYAALVDEYLINGNNLRKAYDKIYAVEDEIQSKTNHWCYQIIKKPEVKRYLELRRKQISEEAMIDSQHVIQELASIGFAVKGDEIYTTKDKLKALELLAKQMGLFEKKEENQEKEIKITIVED